MKKAVLTYGLISGAISATLLATVSISGNLSHNSKGMIIGYTCMVLSFLFIYPAMASYRNNEGNGTIKYGKALVIGLLITAITCTFYSITWMILCKTMFPDFMDKYAASVISQLKASGASAKEIADQAAQMDTFKQMYKNPVMMFLLTFLEPLPVGVLVSVISAFIVRMKNKTTDSSAA